MSQQKSDLKPAILLVTDKMNRGETEGHLLPLVSSLMQVGYFVAVASSGGQLTSELERRGILHLTAPLDKPSRWHRKRAAAILKRAIRRYGFSILHAQSEAAARVCRMAAKSGLFHQKGVGKQGDALRFVTTLYKMPEKIAADRLGERVLTVSEDIRNCLIKTCGIRYERIALTINGIDTDRYDKKARLDLFQKEKVRRWEITHISRLDKDSALTAFLLVAILPKLLKRHDIHLTIVGDGELFKELFKRASRVVALFGDCITMVGAVKDDLCYLRGADLAIGISRPALEAMSCGVATILSGNDGYLGLYEEKKLARAARSDFCCLGEDKPNESRLMHDIEALLEDDERRLRAGEAGRAAVEADYSLQKMTEDHVAFYDSLYPLKRKPYNSAVILGYQGKRSADGDAALDSMIRGIRQEDASRGITVIADCVKTMEADFPIRAIAKRSFFKVLRAIAACDILYIGERPFDRSDPAAFRYAKRMIRLAKLCHKTVAYWANGIGTLSEKEQLTVAKLMATKSVISLSNDNAYHKTVAFVSQFPDKPSKFWQENVKTRYVIAAADSAILAEPCTESRVRAMLGRFDRRPYFVVSTNGCVPKRLRKRYEKELSTAIMLAVEKGFLPLFLVSSHGKEHTLCLRLAKALRKRGFDALCLIPSFEEMMGLIQKAAFVLSSRSRPLLFAAKAGVPAIAYSDDEECLTLADEAFGSEALCRLSKDKNKHLQEAMLSMLIVKSLPQEMSLFMPSARYVEELVQKAVALPTRMEDALLDSALQKKKETQFLRSRKRQIKSV